jgi:peptidoglycan biosynthesis protein MviN/MurJ (putative lipid II flippase)
MRWQPVIIGWAIMAVAMSANGVARVLLLEPRFGARWAGVLSAITGITLIQLIGRWAIRRAGPASQLELASVTVLWLVLTVGFEFAVNLSVDHKTMSELLANYNLLRGHRWPIVLATLVCAPFWARPVSPASVSASPIPPAAAASLDRAASHNQSATEAAAAPRSGRAAESPHGARDLRSHS